MCAVLELGARVRLKPSKLSGYVRGYDPSNKKWWVIVRGLDPKWYNDVELEVIYNE